MPGVAEDTVRVELWFSPGLKDRLAGLIVADRPDDETEVERVTVPLKPRLWTLIWDAFEVPDTIVRVAGLAEIVKSLVTVRVRVVFWVFPFPEPWIVIV